MSKLVQRLLIFFIGIPLVILIVAIKFHNQLPLNIALCFFSVIASLEMYAIFEKKSKLPPKTLIALLSVLNPVCSYLFVLFDLPFNYINWLFLAGIFVVMAYTVFSSKTFESSNLSISLSSFIIFYSGYLLTFITRLTAYKNSIYYIIMFLVTVFMCDSIAWFFGVLLGKNNRGIVAASPNKSVAGFIGGFVGSIASAMLICFLFPEVFSNQIWKAAILGFITAAAAITGDLTESVFKRSSNCKDSGFIIPGRGGVLDSIDSIVFAAPVFYMALHFIFGVPLL